MHLVHASPHIFEIRYRWVLLYLFVLRFRLGASGEIAAFCFPPWSLCIHYWGSTIKNRKLSV